MYISYVFSFDLYNILLLRAIIGYQPTTMLHKTSLCVTQTTKAWDLGLAFFRVMVVDEF